MSTSPSKWFDEAAAAIKAVAERQATVHVNDIGAVSPPPHPNAWGAVWRKLVEDGVLLPTGTVRRCDDPKKRSRTAPVYNSTLVQVPV